MLNSNWRIGRFKKLDPDGLTGQVIKPDPVLDPFKLAHRHLPPFRSTRTETLIKISGERERAAAWSRFRKAFSEQ
ncbi:uncharacterized protein A4U43_C05F6650 [Asparagus officinalis]|uniref:Uncharacterized protein n=1 Tax=Asparagus officinalis TaxID=4686 RepID=A0A5P1ETI9_ASPOF|nr:uncharacterized protein A4U43_C05F6650 [Asparagus officinalis]